jgi:gas vesicle protein GvpL/GvpF
MGQQARHTDEEDASAFYVYCIGEQAGLRPLFEAVLPDAIELGAQLDLIGADDLAAVVSKVPIADYGQQSLEDNIADATWTAIRAMRHERVVEHFAKRASVIPLRFGTVYLRRDRIEAMLSDRRDEMLAIIERLGDREEWAVNIACDQARLLEAVLHLSPRLRQLGERAAAAPPGQAYLLGKQIEALRADEARAETRRVASEIREELSALSHGAVSLRVLKDEANDQGGIVAKLAFLVARDGFDDFREAAENLARKYSGAGFQFEMTGPWPAYNFSTSE